MSPQVTEAKLLASCGGAPMEAWVDRGSSQGWGHWQYLAGKVPLVINPLEVYL